MASEGSSGWPKNQGQLTKAAEAAEKKRRLAMATRLGKGSDNRIGEKAGQESHKRCRRGCEQSFSRDEMTAEETNASLEESNASLEKATALIVKLMDDKKKATALIRKLTDEKEKLYSERHLLKEEVAGWKMLNQERNASLEEAGVAIGELMDENEKLVIQRDQILHESLDTLKQRREDMKEIIRAREENYRAMDAMKKLADEVHELRAQMPGGN